MKSLLRSQYGTTLIGMLVGMLLAMISILAGMTLYKQAIRTSIDTRSDSLQDGQIASAMLALQLELHSAGFRMTGVPVEQIIQSTADTIYWRFKTANADVECRRFTVETDAGLRQRELVLSVINDCDELTELPLVAWGNAVRHSLALFIADAPNEDPPRFGKVLPNVVIAQQNNATCTPYGLGVAGEHTLVTLTVDSAAISAARAIDEVPPHPPFSYPFCLSNIQN